MKTTGLFTTHIVEIEVPSNTGVINLVPFGDVHFGSDGFALNIWKEFVESHRKCKNTYYLGMGDYVDFASASERFSIRGSKLHSTTEELLDTVAYQMIRDFFKHIEFTKDKLIGIIGGNHYWEFQNGMSSDERLAQLANVPFLGCASIIRICLNYPDKVQLHVDVFASHGRGSGKLPGSAYNSVEDMSRYCIADVFLMGHDHSRGIIPGRSRLEPHFCEKENTLLVKERTPYLGRTGSFLKGYEKNKRSYTVDNHYPPTSLGGIKIKLNRVKSEHFGDHIKISGEC